MTRRRRWVDLQAVEDIKSKLLPIIDSTAGVASRWDVEDAVVVLRNKVVLPMDPIVGFDQFCDTYWITLTDEEREQIRRAIRRWCK
ncbi:MAG: hypothetical protein AAGI11_04415 [Pseudomonadota bacterium]